MTLDMSKKFIGAAARGERVSVEIGLHDGIRKLTKAFGDFDDVLSFLEDVEGADDPVFKKEDAK